MESIFAQVNQVYGKVDFDKTDAKKRILINAEASKSPSFEGSGKKSNKNIQTSAPKNKSGVF